eukprot:1140710-Pelagomonas_calceolata.AAC.7
MRKPDHAKYWHCYIHYTDCGSCQSSTFHLVQGQLAVKAEQEGREDLEGRCPWVRAWEGWVPVRYVCRERNRDQGAVSAHKNKFMGTSHLSLYLHFWRQQVSTP